MSESFDSLRGITEERLRSMREGELRSAYGSMDAFDEAADRAKDELERLGVVQEAGPLGDPFDGGDRPDPRGGPYFIFSSHDEELSDVATWAFHLALCKLQSEGKWKQIGVLKELLKTGKKGNEKRSKLANDDYQIIEQKYRLSGGMKRSAFVKSMMSTHGWGKTKVEDAISLFELHVRNCLSKQPAVGRPEKVSRVARELGVSEVLVDRVMKKQR